MDVDRVDGRCPCVNCLIARISLVLIHIGIISIPSIDLVILLRERADGVGLARGVSGNQLGDDVNAKVVALAGGKCVDLRKPLLGGLIIPFVYVNSCGSANAVARRCSIQGDDIGVAEDAVGWPGGGIGPS